MPGVAQGGGHRLDGQAQLASAPTPWRIRWPRCRRWPWCRRRRARRRRTGPATSTRRAAPRRTVPVTWSPRSFAPRTATSTTPAPVPRPHGPSRRSPSRSGPWCRPGSWGPPAGWRPREIRPRARPVGDVAAHQPVGGQDVHEDVLGARAPRPARGRGARPGSRGWRWPPATMRVRVIGQHRGRAARRPPTTSPVGPGVRVTGLTGSGRPARPAERPARRPAAPRRGQLERSARPASARSACPTGSSGGSGS